MRPDVTRVLGGLAETIAGPLIPELATPFARASAGTSAALLGMIAQEFDRAAARQVEENDVVRALLADAIAVVTDAHTKARCADLIAEEPDRDYKVSTLKAENDELRAMLIEVHAHVEGRDDKAAREMDERIWDELRASVARRKLTMGR